MAAASSSCPRWRSSMARSSGGRGTDASSTKPGGLDITGNHWRNRAGPLPRAFVPRIAREQQPSLHARHRQRQQNDELQRAVGGANGGRREASRGAAGIPSAFGGKMKAQRARRDLRLVIERGHQRGDVQASQHGG